MARSAAVVLYLSRSLYPTQAEAAAESALNKKAKSTERASAEHLCFCCMRIGGGALYASYLGDEKGAACIRHCATI
jgi:hypothetical protein